MAVVHSHDAGAPGRWAAGPRAVLTAQMPGKVRRVAVLVCAGGLPVLSISLAVFGAMPMTVSARYLVLPLALAAVVLMCGRSAEGRWALRGFVAGLIAVAAYDTVRMPLVLVHIWPDFIPRIGGWTLGNGRPNVFFGYLWRYVGDGGGIGLVLFVAYGASAARWRRLVDRRPMRVGLAYGVVVWSGLITTIALSANGAVMLFPLTPVGLGLSLLGHVVYGGVLGICLRSVGRPAAQAVG
jgi:hypothetical protein